MCPVCVPAVSVGWIPVSVGSWRLKRSNNALAKALLRDSAEWSPTMPPPTGRQMALARIKPSFVIWNHKWRGAYLHWCKWTNPQVSSAKTLRWRVERRGCKAFTNINNSRYPALWQHHWMRLFTRQLRRLKISWFKPVKTMGHQAGQGNLMTTIGEAPPWQNANQTPLVFVEFVSWRPVHCG